jgi:hypothetical protein
MWAPHITDSMLLACVRTTISCVMAAAPERNQQPTFCTLEKSRVPTHVFAIQHCFIRKNQLFLPYPGKPVPKTCTSRQPHYGPLSGWRILSRKKVWGSPINGDPQTFFMIGGHRQRFPEKIFGNAIIKFYPVKCGSNATVQRDTMQPTEENVPSHPANSHPNRWEFQDPRFVQISNCCGVVIPLWIDE